MAKIKDIVRVTRIDEKTDKALQKKALQEKRTISNMIAVAIENEVYKTVKAPKL